MKHLPIGSISQIDKFLKDNQGMELEIITVKEKYKFIKAVLLKNRYRNLSKKDKHLVLKYLKFLTGYSKGHLKKINQEMEERIIVLQSNKKQK
ncbi:MAG: hypothetical protein U9P70_00775 [Patescibacteria group bacterium]|nr:hypothetical protein [Patescibacteria group bacterium]